MNPLLILKACFSKRAAAEYWNQTKSPDDLRYLAIRQKNLMDLQGLPREQAFREAVRVAALEFPQGIPVALFQHWMGPSAVNRVSLAVLVLSCCAFFALLLAQSVPEIITALVTGVPQPALVEALPHFVVTGGSAVLFSYVWVHQLPRFTKEGFFETEEWRASLPLEAVNSAG